ncbi:MAG: hypothetical protein ABUR63_10750 [Verrucomicrobiota bacterium]
MGPVPRWVDPAAATSANPPPAWALDLVQSADPVSVPITLKQRTLLSLGNGRPPHAGNRWLRPIVVCAVLLSGSAIASAAFTGWPADLVRVCRELVAGPPPARGAVRVAGTHVPRVAPPAARAEAAAEPTDVAGAEAAPPLTRQAIGDGRRRAKLRLPPAEDPAVVVAATRALRVDRDPRRARLLARQYLPQQPRGALAEEALAIEVEAALDHDDDDATAEALRYLSLYPHGAFRAVAERALSAR